MTPADSVPRRTLWALAALRVAAGLVVASLTLTSDHLDERGLETALDGRLELERPPGRGTRVEAAFPVGSR